MKNSKLTIEGLEELSRSDMQKKSGGIVPGMLVPIIILLGCSVGLGIATFHIKN